MKIISEFSPNFSNKIRKKNQIRFVIIHYTGMQSEIESFKRLINPNSKVSCHYLINRKGLVIQLVKDQNIAWHAGKSKWQQNINLNKNSIGIELVNKGHNKKYQSFSSHQIKSLIQLCKILKKKYKIKKNNFLGHSDIAPLRKKDPGEKFPWKKLSSYNIGKWYRQKNKRIKFTKKNVHKLFFKNLKKIGYRYFSISKRKNSDTKVIRSFQQHYLQNNVTGKIDEKTFNVSHFLVH